MLGKTKTGENESAPAPIFEDRQPAEQPTIIGKEVAIDGNITGKEDLLIEGTVKGSVGLEGKHLTVGPRGEVNGEITAQNVTVSGRVQGNIKAHGKVSITRDANFNGEIHARSISVEDGAFLKASIELHREPQMKAVSGGKAQEAVSPKKETQ